MAAKDTPEPLSADVVGWADTQWGDLSDDEVVAVLRDHLADTYGRGYSIGLDGKRYPNYSSEEAVVVTSVLAAYLHDQRDIGLRDLGRRINRSHATIRRWIMGARGFRMPAPESRGLAAD